MTALVTALSCTAVEACEDSLVPECLNGHTSVYNEQSKIITELAEQCNQTQSVYLSVHYNID